MTCRLCGGAVKPWLFMPIDAKTYEPTPFGRVVRCADCRLARVDPLPQPEDVPAFYQLGAYYTHGRSHFSEGDPPTLLDRVRLHLAWRVDRSRPFDAAGLVSNLKQHAAGKPRICDVGCGGGDMLRSVVEAGGAATGVDPDPGVIATLSAEGLDVRHGAAEALPESLDRGTFDAVIMSHSLEHCIDPFAAVKGVAALLKPNGLFVCETPNAAAAHFQRFTVISEMFDAPRHLWFFEPDTLSRVLASAGLEEVARAFTGYSRLFSNAWRATENRILDGVQAAGVEPFPRAPRHGRRESWRLLAATVGAPPARKYDSVRVTARRTEGAGM